MHYTLPGSERNLFGHQNEKIFENFSWPSEAPDYAEEKPPNACKYLQALGKPLPINLNKGRS